MIEQLFIESRQLSSKLSSKGQVTIPIEIRRLLGFKTNDKVAFIIENKEVKLSSARYPSIASLVGAAGSLKKPLGWKKVRAIAKQDHLEGKYGT